MTQDAIPSDVRRFILTSINSVPFLEAMLLMQSEPHLAWDASRLAQRLYIAEKPAATLLDELCNAGFIEHDAQEGDGYYKFMPSSQALMEMCERLAKVYAANIVSVANLIHSNVDKRAQQFADAFKWRKD